MTLAYWSTCFISDKSFSKLVNLSLNLNTNKNSRSAGNEVVANTNHGKRIPRSANNKVNEVVAVAAAAAAGCANNNAAI
ncbi:hypothetical protein Tco_1436174 [Tanacetum coccineum]